MTRAGIVRDVRLYEGRIVSGLVLAGTMGCALFVPGVLVLLFVAEWQRNWWIGINLALALSIQPIIVVAAVGSLKYMQVARRDWFKISGSRLCGIYGIVLLAIFGLAYSPVPRNIVYNESRAEGWLASIASRNDLIEYLGAKDASLPEGKPDCHSDDPFWPFKPTFNGYNFEYRALVSETTVGGCRLDTSLIITARPVAYRKTGIRSFLVYRTQDDKWPNVKYVRIHFTSEDRPATLSDPADEIGIFQHRYNPQ